jgi:hypothetical protein
MMMIAIYFNFIIYNNYDNAANTAQKISTSRACVKNNSVSTEISIYHSKKEKKKQAIYNKDIMR